jgi:hypothetical protein
MVGFSSSQAFLESIRVPIVIASAPVRTSGGSIALGGFLPGRGRESSDEAEDAMASVRWVTISENQLFDYLHQLLSMSLS